jgi:glucuronate isomerase
MKTFMSEDFMLKNHTAKKLYHDYAKDMPIYDYHCHLSAKEIAENKRYKDITEIWLAGDHYKWRAMRSNGVNEEYMTGDKSSKEKFMKWAETVPYTIGNPLYHWTHLELKRYFHIEEILSPATAENIWNSCNEKLQKSDMTARALIKKSNVKVICTTDDPVDNLEYHIQLANDSGFETKVLPTFRPDKSFNIDVETFIPWIKSLSHVVGCEIDSLDKLLTALEERIDYFHEVGCRLSDHALDTIEYISPNKEKAKEIFLKRLKGEDLSKEEVAVYKGYILNFLGKAYAARGWAMQLHIGALRNNNRRMYETLGPDTGFDSIHDSTFAPQLSKLLNDLDATDEMPKTIIYVLNPRDNYVIGTMIGNFQGGGIPGKIQFGSGWWFCDQKEGMIDQMKALSSLGLISRFIGMLTDSRSFLSYTRHEYFRRILCNLIGEWIEEGEYPSYMEFVGSVVKDICYYNAERYFSI